MKCKANKLVNCPSVQPAAFTNGLSAKKNLLHFARFALKIMTILTFFPRFISFSVGESTKFYIVFPKINLHITLPSISIFPICFPHASVRRFQEMLHFRPGQQMFLHSNLSNPGVGPIHPPIQTLQSLFLRR